MMSGQAQFNIATGRIVRQLMEIDKRILGFAGPTSSMHYLMRMEEKAVDAPPQPVAGKPNQKRAASPARDIVSNETAATPDAPAAVSPATRSPTSKATKPRRPARTSRRPRSAPQGTKGYSR
jgi:hypothetical protein